MSMLNVVEERMHAVNESRNFESLAPIKEEKVERTNDDREELIEKSVKIACIFNVLSFFFSEVSLDVLLVCSKMDVCLRVELLD